MNNSIIKRCTETSQSVESDSITIRGAKEEDREVIRALLHGSLRRSYDGNHVAQGDRILDTHLAGGKDKVGHFSLTQRVFVAELKGKVIGIMNIAEKRQGTMKISPLIIDPDYRGGNRAGSALLNKAIEIAKMLNVRQIYGTVAETSSWIEAFYLNRGWTCGSQSKSQYRPGIVEHAIYLNVNDSADVHNDTLTFVEFSNDKYEELSEFLLQHMPTFADGIDSSFIQALVAGHTRRKAHVVEEKYKEIYMGYEGSTLSAVVTFGPKKGEAVKLMPLCAISRGALQETLRFAQSWAAERTHKLYTHQPVNPMTVTAFEDEMWILEGLLPESYKVGEVSVQWGWFPGEITHLGRIGDRFKTYSERLLSFVQERGWDELEDARSLSMAIGGEVGELLAELQWLNNDDVVEKLQKDNQFKKNLEFEAADILNYLIRFSYYCEFDLIEVADKKLAVNIDRFPIEEVYGIKGKTSN
ncbi:GNAT family N-acetyltransferase [Photorhabdus temperata]|uniref:N-acetyltransferase domain-containing protein n=1 Tax=Photorhabdus temperata J3 TaxID=1389415 RepID=U7QZV6_PHOTE|nr:GNAT family N-acetyltransferase [Photorhabdus temperata]ERT13604.1 hypothetical protein O185_07960 [Photorhabdus temperata J3]